MGESSLKTEFYKVIHKDEDIFDALLFASIEGFLFLDLINFENAWLSSKYWELLGYDPKEMEQHEYAWKDTVFEEDLNKALEDLGKHSEDDDYLFDQLLRHRHKNGSIVWMRFRGIVLKDEHGKAKRLAASFSDASSSMEMEKKMMRLADEYETIFNGTRDAMFLLEVLENGEFRFIDNNHAHQKKTKLMSEDIAKKTPQEVFGKEIGDAACENYRECVKNKKSISYEEKLDLPEGELYWLTTLTPIIEDDTVIKIMGSATDITQMKELELKLDRLANYDTLTGIPNRRLFFERLKQLIAEIERDNTQFALLFIDLDGFKEINDNYSHETGDEVLITVGKRLSNHIRKSDTVARMGGDEFAVLLRDIKDKEAIQLVVEKIHKSLQEVIKIGDDECYVNSSIGIAIYPNDGKDSETLLRNADSVMYEIKRKGKAGYEFFDDSKEAEASDED